MASCRIPRAASWRARAPFRLTLSSYPRHLRFNHTASQDPSIKSLDSILIANRGEIAIRVNRTAAQHGHPHHHLIHQTPTPSLSMLDSSPFAFNLGDTSAYLDQEKILKIAKEQGCQAIHPGYGFLSENKEFAKRCAEEGITFIGPPASAIEDMGDKARSKEIMNAAGVPCVHWLSRNQSRSQSFSPRSRGPSDIQFLSRQFEEVVERG